MRRAPVALDRNTNIATGRSLKPLGLIVAFFATALLYASVGFGGGSTYTALLTLTGTDFRILPFVSLVCNVIVVTGATIRFTRAGLVPWRKMLPLVVASAPMALLGGLTPIKQPVFMAVLGISLLVAGGLLVWQRERTIEAIAPKSNAVVDGAMGGAIGYLSGLVGIGGGIFLAPLLYLLRWGEAKQIAATASFFILVNSIAGLIGQSIKLGNAGELGTVLAYWPLAVAVLVGGQIGSWLGIKILPPAIVRRATGALILYVAIQLLWKNFGN
jgi:uncharacterized protein